MKLFMEELISGRTSSSIFIVERSCAGESTTQCAKEKVGLGLWTNQIKPMLWQGLFSAGENNIRVWKGKSGKEKLSKRASSIMWKVGTRKRREVKRGMKVGSRKTEEKRSYPSTVKVCKYLNARHHPQEYRPFRYLRLTRVPRVVWRFDAITEIWETNQGNKQKKERKKEKRDYVENSSWEKKILCYLRNWPNRVMF